MGKFWHHRNMMHKKLFFGASNFKYTFRTRKCLQTARYPILKSSKSDFQSVCPSASLLASQHWRHNKLMQFNAAISWHNNKCIGDMCLSDSNKCLPSVLCAFPFTFRSFSSPSCKEIIPRFQLHASTLS